jgi:hypothetical protein
MPKRADDTLRKVTLNGDCLEYQGALTDDGYGQFWYQGRHWMAHRYSYIKHKGAIPEGMIVRHTCDNPACINAEHLIAGTQQNNIDDCVAKGRRYKHDRKITPEQVEEMELLRGQGATYKALGEKYGVTKQTIYRYLNGQM